MPPSTLSKAKSQIEQFLEASPLNVFSEAELSGQLEEQREAWHLALRTTASDFISFLVGLGRLKPLRISSSYGNVIRYAWDEYSAFDLGASLKRMAYFSHGSAMFLHGLTERIPRLFYINNEQTPKAAREASLSQERLDRAFARPQRQSRYVYAFDSWRFVLLSGKATRRLGVQSMKSSTDHPLTCTALERTLIDSTVRPAYAGGVYDVLSAYRAARERLNLARLLEVLLTLDYIYPYHQAVGFYLQRAGFPESDLQPFRKLGLEYDFYLSHGLRERSYDASWRIFYPKDLESIDLPD